ncbi:hypothetical protein [Lichenihabitans psoromatis]|uniref:hypothetical protein n=1 Tax=Lichenihabitans psoromatis TaxID=2528642 RepID=UPI001036D29B|nr:hypothetical protein [Lichenihabitans psoromatis]
MTILDTAEALLDFLWEQGDDVEMICIAANAVPTSELDPLIAIVADDWPTIRLIVTGSATQQQSPSDRIEIYSGPMSESLMTEIVSRLDKD